MKEFKFEQHTEEKDALFLLKQHKKKLAKQQIIFAAAFIVALIFLIF